MGRVPQTHQPHCSSTPLIRADKAILLSVPAQRSFLLVRGGSGELVDRPGVRTTEGMFGSNSRYNLHHIDPHCFCVSRQMLRKSLNFATAGLRPTPNARNRSNQSKTPQFVRQVSVSNQQILLLSDVPYSTTRLRPLSSFHTTDCANSDFRFMMKEELSKVLGKRCDSVQNLTALMDDGNWTTFRSSLYRRQEELKVVDEKSGWTILHHLCDIPPVPLDIFQNVVELYPDATKVRGKRWGPTPLHILCGKSQKSLSKVEILLKHMAPEDLLIRTHFGGTALHSACANHAWIPVLKALIRANPSIVMARTSEYSHTALTALWQSHLQTIPGAMQVARILEGDEVHENHFCKFWEKVILLATEAAKLSPAFDPNTNPGDIENYTLHGLQCLRAPLKVLKVAIKRHPQWAAYPDVDGNYPLHLIVIQRPFRIKDIELITDLTEAYPEAASTRNKEGEAPIFIALRERMSWNGGVGELVKAQPDILSSRDRTTGLFPFLLAASLTGKVAVENTYELLVANPHLVKK